MRCRSFQSFSIFSLLLLRDLAVCSCGNSAPGATNQEHRAACLAPWLGLALSQGQAGLPSFCRGCAAQPPQPGRPCHPSPVVQWASRQRSPWRLPQEQQGHLVFESFPSETLSSLPDDRSNLATAIGQSLLTEAYYVPSLLPRVYSWGHYTAL